MSPERRENTISVRLSEEEYATLERWSDKDPLVRGMGHQIRRLIHEEMNRERRDAASDRAG